jgi:acetylornithine deacetylase/succinyl-diaminopimelate desuccinylase-like protein
VKLHCCISAVLCLFLSVAATAQSDDATRDLAHDIFKQLIEINTTDSVGSVTAASEAMAPRFREAGFPESDIHVLGPNDRKKNLVVRLHGTGKHKPVLLIGHLDVVEARREDWTSDPFQFVEKDGYFYGRGTQDMKSGDAIMAATLIRMKKENYQPDRDIILALTADEEGGKSNGVDWLLKNQRDLIEAEFVLNHDGGGILADHGKPLMMEVDATEKLYADFQLTVTNPGGHSSLPVPDNAIYHLANGLTRLEGFPFPFELNNVTREFFRASERQSYPPPTLRPDVFRPLERVTAETWAGVPVIPTMATGASDGIYTNAAGLPTYGISGISIDRTDIRAHGKDERVGVESFYRGLGFYHEYLRALTSLAD